MTAVARDLRPPPPDPANVDLADPRLHTDHDLGEVWRGLRDVAPVHWHEPPGRPGFWVLTRYADVMAVYRDTERFTSERGNVLDTLLAGGDNAAGKMAAVTDGPRHADLRAIMLRGFTPRALEAAAGNVRAATRALVADAVERGDCDFAADVAAQIPLAAICDLLGVPAGDRAVILGLTSSALASEAGAPTDEETWNARNEILLYFADLAERRRADPADDIVSALVGATVDGRPLTHEEIIYNCYSLILGGDETTRYAMIGGVRALAQHPAQWAALKDGSAPVASAVEEILRWTTPTLHAGRTATTDVLWSGKLLEAGDLVTIWNISANADERQFPDPDAFLLDRRPNRHVTFAYGAHFCLGAYLARVELTALLTALRDLVARIDVTGTPRPVYSNFLNGFASLPVHLTPERAP